MDDMEIGIRWLQGSPGERRLICKLIEERASHYRTTYPIWWVRTALLYACRDFQIDFTEYEKFMGSNG